MADIGAKIEMERLKERLEFLKKQDLTKDEVIEQLHLYADNVIKECESGYR